MKVQRTTRFLPALITFFIIMLIWECFVRITHISSDILPAPSSIMIALIQNWDTLAIHTLQTVLETVLGIFTAIIFGVIAAVILDASPGVRKAVYPILITSQTIPIIALAPLLLIWLGFDVVPKVIVVTLYCFFPITIALADGLTKIDQELVNLFRSMDASYWQTVRQLKFPSALPYFFSGLKIAVTYSMTGAIVGEYVGAYQGLGVVIQSAANSHAIALVFAAIFLIACISILLFIIVVLIERATLQWQHSK